MTTSVHQRDMVSSFFNRFLKHRILERGEEEMLLRLVRPGPIGVAVPVTVHNTNDRPRSCKTGVRRRHGKKGRSPIVIQRPRAGDTLFGVCHLSVAYTSTLPEELVPTGIELHVYPKGKQSAVATIPCRYDTRWGWYARWNSKEVDNGEYRLVITVTDALAQRATDLVMSLNYRFVLNVARKYLWSGMDLEDLFGEGVLGLKVAVEKFDPDRGIRFVTYAIWWIRQSIYLSVQTKSRTIRIPNQQWERYRGIREAQKKFGDDISSESIAEYVGVKTNKALDGTKIDDTIRHFTTQVQPLDIPTDSDNGFSALDVIADDLPDQLEILLAKEDDAKAMQALSILAPREQDILKHRFGIGTDEPQTLADIASTYGLSRERIRQIQDKALEKMRKHLAQQQR